MKIVVEEKPVDEIEVYIRTPKVDSNLAHVIALLQTSSAKLVGDKNGKTYLIDLTDVLYVESVDKRCFIYTKTDVYESRLALYELEDRLAQTEFLRISKQMLVNFDAVCAIKPEVGAKLRLTLSNGEDVVASRQYSVYIKKKISCL